MSQENKLKGPFPQSELGFNIMKVDKDNRKIKIEIQFRSQALMDRLNELFGVETAAEAQSTELDYSELTLQLKLDHLLQLEIIRKKQYDNYFTKINDKKTAPGLLRYFEKQFDLFHRLYLLAGNKMSDDTRATIYKRIMSSKMKDFSFIDDELKNMEAA